MKYTLSAQRGTKLRRNTSSELIIKTEQKNLDFLLLIKGNRFLTENLTLSDLLISPNAYYMVINNGDHEITLSFNQEISKHQIIYNPYKYEQSEKKKLEKRYFEKNYDVPHDYVDTLPKWYSFKFTYPSYNLIFVRPECGISIQTHKHRSESWEIQQGKPIVISDNEVHYFVEDGAHFTIPSGSYHSIINPNKEKERYVLLKERWSGDFQEGDISRAFNPNHYY
ncbi:MAG: hypothetical protein GF383_01565 [Candidatus Lokiarchaeota archaeon]|nr:hypothetical protein [Candidatus Lokiarchaeota archaeon]MBD3337968.1 hypothetical protein [Candidatus Lokiarchaeota archaeon]